MNALDARRIGGQLEIDPRSLVSSPVPPDGAIWTSTARAALALVERTLPAGPVVLPSYVCDAVTQPFRRAGRTIRFYRVDESLRVDVDDLVRCVEIEPTAAAVIVHYFGLPAAGGAEAVATLRPHVRVIEDCAQGGVLEPDSTLARHGDYVVTSLRKYLPVPDGAALFDRVGNVDPQLEPGPTPLAVSRLAGQLLRHQVLAGELGDAAEQAYVTLFERSERDLDDAFGLEAAWELSRSLASAIDLSAARERRRANFVFLAALLGERVPDIAHVVAGEPAPSGSPLVFPVRVAAARRDDLRSALLRRRVFAAVHWPLPRGVDPVEFPEASRLADEILCLPLDQRYGQDEMVALVEAVADAWSEVE